VGFQEVDAGPAVAVDREEDVVGAEVYSPNFDAADFDAVAKEACFEGAEAVHHHSPARGMDSMVGMVSWVLVPSLPTLLYRPDASGSRDPSAVPRRVHASLYSYSRSHSCDFARLMSPCLQWYHHHG
jgi:hypothetical protein